MTFREALSQRKIDVPNNLLEIPDIDIKTKKDIENLIKLLKDRIEEFKLLLNQQVTPPPMPEPIRARPTLSSIPQTLRSRMDVAQPLRTRIRPTQFGDTNLEEARREFRETQTFLLNRDLNNTNDLTLIERALLRLNRNKNFINSILIDPDLKPKERNLLRDLLKQVEVNINRISNRKLTLQGKTPKKEDTGSQTETGAQTEGRSASVEAEMEDEREQEQILRDKAEAARQAEILKKRQQMRDEADDEEEREEDAAAGFGQFREIRAPQKRNRPLPQYIKELQEYLSRYGNVLGPQALNRQQNNLAQAMEELADLQRQEGRDDEIRDALDVNVDDRIKEVRKYINDIVSTGRSQVSIGKIRNDLEKYVDDLVREKDTASNDVLTAYINNRYLLLDLSNGDWPAATAFQNFISLVKPSDATTKIGDKITLKPLNMDEVKQNHPKARQQYGLFKNGVRVLTNEPNLNSVEREYRSRFTRDGDIYNQKDLNPEVQEIDEDDFNEDDPVAEEGSGAQQEQQPEDFTARNAELASYRNQLFYTGRPGQKDIVDKINQEIGDAMNSNKVIILDKANDIPSAIAYYRLPPDRIAMDDIDTIQLVADRQGSPGGGRITYMLYINGNLQRNNIGQPYIFNSFGDTYSTSDFTNEDVSVSFPFRPTNSTGDL
jgi:hypothetical protein